MDTSRLAWVVGFLLLLASGALGAATGQTDQMSWLDNGQIRLGADLTIGGAITYLADAARKNNVINSHDWGRQIQMSFYSGPRRLPPRGRR